MLKTTLLVRHASRHVTHNLFETNRTPSSTAYYHGGFFWRKILILHPKTLEFAYAGVAQIMSNFWRKMLILACKTPKIAPAGVAQIMTNFWRKTLILHAKTLKIGLVRVEQIMTNLWRKTVILHAKTPKFAPARDNELKLWGLGSIPEGHLPRIR